MFHVPQKVVVMFSISYLVYSVNYIVLGTLLQCKLPCVLTNNNKDQSRVENIPGKPQCGQGLFIDHNISV